MKVYKIELYIRDFFFFIAMLFICFLFLFTLHKQNKTIKALEQVVESNNLVLKQLTIYTVKLNSADRSKYKNTIIFIPVDYPSSELFKLAFFQGSNPFEKNSKK